MLRSQPARGGRYQHVRLHHHISPCIGTWWHGHVLSQQRSTVSLHYKAPPVPEIPQKTPSSRWHKKPRDCRAAPLKPAVSRRDATWLEKCRDSRGDMQWNGNQKRFNELHNEDSSCMLLSILPSYILNGRFRWDSQAWVFYCHLLSLASWFHPRFPTSPKATRFNCDMSYGRNLVHGERTSQNRVGPYRFCSGGTPPHLSSKSFFGFLRVYMDVYLLLI